MGEFSGFVAGALIYGVLIGVMFSFAYPTVEITTPLGGLFGLGGLLLAWLTRWGWRHVQSRRGYGKHSGRRSETDEK